MGKPIFDTRQLPMTMKAKPAADLMQVSEGHLRKLLREGIIKARKVGKGWLIPTNNILDYMGMAPTS